MPTIHIIATKLTDLSVVHDVRVPEMRLAALTERDAQALALSIANAIRRYTNETARVEEI